MNDDLIKFEDIVKMYLNASWYPVGGVSIIIDPHSLKKSYYQAMSNVDFNRVRY